MNETHDAILWLTCLFGLFGLFVLFIGVVLWICFEMEKTQFKKPVDSDARARLRRKVRK